MKYLITLLLSTFGLTSFSQSTYYFANNGNDSNSGTNSASPFNSIAKLNTLNLEPGDKVLLHCGDIFYGQVTIKNSGTQANNIVISSYGNGKRPIISGAKKITGWQRMPGSNNIWQASCITDTTVTDFYENYMQLTLGRYPNINQFNHGYLTIKSHNGNTQITSKEPVTKDWTNAELVFKPAEYLCEKPKIGAVNGNTFTVLRESAKAFDKWGYFIQNSLQTLDADGEWYVDPAKKMIYVYWSYSSPNNHDLEVTSCSKGIRILNSNYITVENIEINKIANTGFYTSKSSDLKIKNVTVAYSGEDGITIFGNCNNVVMEDNKITHCNNNGVVIWNTTDFKFIGNRISNCGTIVGRGKADNGASLGFQYNSTVGPALIANNIIDSTGYNGLEFRSPNVIVKQNLVSNFCMLKGDGGGIYTFNGQEANYDNMIVIDNVVIGCHGDSISINNSRPHINGIYMDDCSTNVKVIGNTVMNCEQAGIFIHGNSNMTLDSNTLFNNNIGYYDGYGKCDSKNNSLSNNIIISKAISQPLIVILTHNDPQTIARFSNNTYFTPNKQRAVLVVPNTADSKQNQTLSVHAWKNNFSQERVISDIDDAASIKAYELKLNTEREQKTIPLNGNYTDMQGNKLGRTITLQPYSSMIVCKN